MCLSVFVRALLYAIVAHDKVTLICDVVRQNNEGFGTQIIDQPLGGVGSHNSCRFIV